MNSRRWRETAVRRAGSIQGRGNDESLDSGECDDVGERGRCPAAGSGASGGTGVGRATLRCGFAAVRVCSARRPKLSPRRRARIEMRFERAIRTKFRAERVVASANAASRPLCGPNSPTIATAATTAAFSPRAQHAPREPAIKALCRSPPFQREPPARPPSRARRWR